MSLQSQWSDSQSGDFQARVSMAALQQAAVVYAEPVGTANHAERLALAFAVLKNPDEIIKRLSRLCVIDGVTTAGTLDADLLTRVGSLWTPLSLAHAAA